MSYCCCSLAGTAACRTCSNNPNAETPPPVRTNTLVSVDSVLITGCKIVAKGKWEQVDDYRYPWGCSNCHNTFSEQYNFCPNCGADMREDK